MHHRVDDLATCRSVATDDVGRRARRLKTAFAKELATFLSSGFYSVAVENAQTGAALGGSAQYWSNTCTGKVFDALIDDDFANPGFLSMSSTRPVVIKGTIRWLRCINSWNGIRQPSFMTSPFQICRLMRATLPGC